MPSHAASPSPATQGRAVFLHRDGGTDTVQLFLRKWAGSAQASYAAVPVGLSDLMALRNEIDAALCDKAPIRVPWVRPATAQSAEQFF